ncbi:MAG: CHASE3 domain-containing protein, partial [Myxococcaceae bacterium]|nr:CHASE3 domain-containing protein [Myxococcaceae bacterium]
MTALVAAVTAVLAALGLASVQNAREQAASALWVAHTHRVIESLQRIVSSVAEAESALRGYSIARDETFLVEIDPACREATDAVAQARERVADDPGQLERLAVVDQAVRERLLLIMERKAAVVAGASPQVPARAHALTRQITSTVDEMLRVERGLLDERAAETAAAA